MKKKNIFLISTLLFLIGTIKAKTDDIKLANSFKENIIVYHKCIHQEDSKKALSIIRVYRDSKTPVVHVANGTLTALEVYNSFPEVSLNFIDLQKNYIFYNNN